MLIVNGVPGSVSKATMTACEKIDGSWINVLPTFQAVVGKNGIAQESGDTATLKNEGDYLTPAGIFGLGEFFGWTPVSDPVVQQFKWDYRYIIDVKDINGKYFDKFVDDVSSPYYNTWVAGPTDAKSFEQMRITPYKYGLVINWNMFPTIPGRGSAIFMHIWSGPEGSTAGCVALGESNLITVLQWLDKTKQPLIQIVAPNSFKDKQSN
jgi:L,D-peptidoglycan transpeptidase YkuD (ErfK/YbiS/YcfS/YnhG family)